MGRTSIEWTATVHPDGTIEPGFSVNPIRATLLPMRENGPQRIGHHCEKISDGCKNCYASALQRRFNLPEFAGPSRRENVRHFLDESKLQEVLRRRKPTRYFWCDMTDIFGAWVKDEWLDRCFAVMALTPQHTHQVLTKRPERMRDYILSADGREFKTDFPGVVLKREPFDWPLRNCWLGVSCENQAAADARIPLLLRTPAAIRFLSCEPLLGPVDLAPWLGAGGTGPGGRRYWNATSIDWCIIGGESGPNARPCDLAWIRSLVRQCRSANVACFVKQVGARPFVTGPPDGYMAQDERKHYPLRLRDPKGGDLAELPADLRVREYPKVQT